MSENVEVFVEICREGAVIPKYAKPWDAGMDICAAEDVIIRPGETVIVPTGLKMAIPEGYEIQVRPRSGISLNTPLRITNSPGTIDSGYRDEIGIIITNTSRHPAAEKFLRGRMNLPLTAKAINRECIKFARGTELHKLCFSVFPEFSLKWWIR